jgi:hypothetical protein
MFIMAWSSVLVPFFPGDGGPVGTLFAPGPSIFLVLFQKSRITIRSSFGGLTLSQRKPDC